MSKRKRTKGKQQSGTSLFIPIFVGVAVVAIIVGAIVTLEKRQSLASAAPPTISVPIVTAQPLPTTQIPYPNVPRISIKQAKEKQDKGQALIVDVRGEAAYNQAHVAGAISLPEDQVDARLGELPRDKLIILY